MPDFLDMNAARQIEYLINYLPQWNKRHSTFVAFVVTLDFLFRLKENYDDFFEMDILSESTDLLGEQLIALYHISTETYPTFFDMRSTFLRQPEKIKKQLMYFWKQLFWEDRLESMLYHKGIMWSVETWTKKFVTLHHANAMAFHLKPFVLKTYS